MNRDRLETMTSVGRDDDAVVSLQPETARAALPERRAPAPLRVLYTVATAPGHLLGGRKLPRPPLYLLTLILFVVLPSLLSQIYLIFLASDQFAAESRFAVRSGREQQQGSSAMSAISQGGGMSAPSLVGQDAYVIVSYIRSRAIIDDVAKTIDLRSIFARTDADFWARLPKDAPVEVLTDYWRKMVTAEVDGPSGIVTLTVRAFTPQDALTLSNAILTASEELANTISDRARRDALARSEAEVRRGEGMVRQALAEMQEFRQSVGFIDPVAQATATSKLIAESMVEKIKLENDLFVASQLLSPNAPTLAATNLKLQSVNEQIGKLKATLTGKDASESVIANSLVKFEEIEIKRQFAEKLYSLAQDELERSRVAANQKAVYVTVFVPPQLPEEAAFPERFQMSLVIPITLLIIWGIFAMTAAAIEDHRI
jgi:capsular polysaccharide transport system permease protein